MPLIVDGLHAAVDAERSPVAGDDAGDKERQEEYLGGNLITVAGEDDIVLVCTKNLVQRHCRGDADDGNDRRYNDGYYALRYHRLYPCMAAENCSAEEHETMA